MYEITWNIVNYLSDVSAAMDSLKKGWFTEACDLWPGMVLSLKVKSILHREKSKFQDILVFETESHGRVLVLDGIIQCLEFDEFSYQEMISFLPLAAHPNPRSVLIVGGGDGGVARDVAKYPTVEKIVQVEIDESVVNVSKKYLKFMSVGFDSPKLKLVIGDGFAFMKEHTNEFDVIITDSSDPIGPAVQLFEKEYFELIKGALRPGGILCSQGSSHWQNMSLVSRCLSALGSLYPVAKYATTSVPSYPSGSIGFLLASLDPELTLSEPSRSFTDEELEAMNVRYYTSDVHRAAFVLPRFTIKALRT